MTRVKHKGVICILCGTTNDVRIVSSSSAFFKPDLDFRPPFMIKYNIFYLVNRCCKCGYCNIDLDEKINNAEEVIQSERYQNQLENESFREKANQFLCMAMINENAGDIVKAGKDDLNAAWICDDAKDKKRAAECRKSALEKFQLSLEQNLPILKSREQEQLLIADLHRRIGQFEQAEKISRSAINANMPNELKKLFQYELYLCGIKDDECHSMDEGLELTEN